MMRQHNYILYPPVPGVIVEVPLAAVGVLGIGGVVATAQGAAVVADGVAVVAGAGHAVRVAGQAQAGQGEAHHGAQLLPEPLCRGKPLEVDNKDLRKSVQSVSLGAFPSRLASFTTLTKKNRLFLYESNIKVSHYLPAFHLRQEFPPW